jgi:hypothetical protein
VVFTEVGYRSTTTAAIEPRTWPEWHRHGASSRRGAATDFTPQGKPAEGVIRKWYTAAH